MKYSPTPKGRELTPIERFEEYVRHFPNGFSRGVNPAIIKLLTPLLPNVDFNSVTASMLQSPKGGYEVVFRQGKRYLVIDINELRDLYKEENLAQVVLMFG